MTAWNFDMSAAPRGRVETVERTIIRDGQTVTRVDKVFAPDWILAASECGKVIKTHWVPKQGNDGERWLFFCKGKGPIAWMELPKHPFADKQEAA